MYKKKRKTQTLLHLLMTELPLLFTHSSKTMWPQVTSLKGNGFYTLTLCSILTSETEVVSFALNHIEKHKMLPTTPPPPPNGQVTVREKTDRETNRWTLKPLYTVLTDALLLALCNILHWIKQFLAALNSNLSPKLTYNSCKMSEASKHMTKSIF